MSIMNNTRLSHFLSTYACAIYHSSNLSDAKNTSEKMDDVVRFTPYGIFTTSLLLIATLLVLSFKADYRRLNLDLPTDV